LSGKEELVRLIVSLPRVKDWGGILFFWSDFGFRVVVCFLSRLFMKRMGY